MDILQKWNDALLDHEHEITNWVHNGYKGKKPMFDIAFFAGEINNSTLEAAKAHIEIAYSEWPEYTDETLRYHQKQLKALDSLKDPQG